MYLERLGGIRELDIDFRGQVTAFRGADYLTMVVADLEACAAGAGTVRCEEWLAGWVENGDMPSPMGVVDCKSLGACCVQVRRWGIFFRVVLGVHWDILFYFRAYSGIDVDAYICKYGPIVL